VTLKFHPIIDSGLADTLIEKIEAMHVASIEEFLALIRVTDLNVLFAQRLDTGINELGCLATDLEKQIDPHIIKEYLSPVPEEYYEQWTYGSLPPPDIAEVIPEDAEPKGKYSLTELAMSKVSHIPKLYPIKSQGNRGTCVAFGSVSMREFMLQKGCQLSEQYLYWGAKMRDGHEDVDGTWIKYAVQCLEEEGVCREEDWPYNPNKGTTTHQGPPQKRSAIRNASKFRIIEGIAIQPTAVNDLRRWLAGVNGRQGRVIAFAIPVFPSWYRNPITYRTGRIPMPIPGESYIGGHCMALVGYEDNDESPGGGFFILRNSWGNRWAADCSYGAGYGTIPYAFLTRYGWEAYAGMAKGEDKMNKNIKSRSEDGVAPKKPRRLVVLIVAVIILLLIYFVVTVKNPKIDNDSAQDSNTSSASIIVTPKIVTQRNTDLKSPPPPIVVAVNEISSSETVPQLAGKLLSQQILTQYDNRIKVIPCLTGTVDNIGRILEQNPQPGEQLEKGSVLSVWVGRYKGTPGEMQILDLINGAIRSDLAGNNLAVPVLDLSLEGPITEVFEPVPLPFGQTSRWEARYDANLIMVINNVSETALNISSVSDPRVKKEAAKSEARQKLMTEARSQLYRYYQGKISGVTQGKPGESPGESKTTDTEAFGESLIDETERLSKALDDIINDLAGSKAQ